MLLPRAAAALAVGLTAGIVGRAYAAGTILPAPPAPAWAWPLIIVGLLLGAVGVAAALVVMQQERRDRRRMAEIRFPRGGAGTRRTSG